MNNSYKSLTLLSSNRFPTYNMSSLLLLGRLHFDAFVIENFGYFKNVGNVAVVTIGILLLVMMMFLMLLMLVWLEFSLGSGDFAFRLDK